MIGPLEAPSEARYRKYLVLDPVSHRCRASSMTLDGACRQAALTSPPGMVVARRSVILLFPYD